jgi:hypothetical protein
VRTDNGNLSIVQVYEQPRTGHAIGQRPSVLEEKRNSNTTGDDFLLTGEARLARSTAV